MLAIVQVPMATKSAAASTTCAASEGARPEVRPHATFERSPPVQAETADSVATFRCSRLSAAFLGTNLMDIWVRFLYASSGLVDGHAW